MKALVKTAKGDGFLEIREYEVPKIREEDWVLIKVKAAGVCGTDLHIWHGLFQLSDADEAGRSSGIIRDIIKEYRMLCKLGVLSEVFCLKK